MSRVYRKTRGSGLSEFELGSNEKRAVAAINFDNPSMRRPCAMPYFSRRSVVRHVRSAGAAVILIRAKGGRKWPSGRRKANMDTGQSDFTDPPSAVKYVIRSSDVISGLRRARNRRNRASGHGIPRTVAMYSRREEEKGGKRRLSGDQPYLRHSVARCS